MNEIKIAKQYVPLVLAGQKESTIRAGKRDYELGPAALILPDFNRINIEITAILVERYGTLDDEDAWADGFRNLSELRAELRRFYPDLAAESIITIVYFALV